MNSKNPIIERSSSDVKIKEKEVQVVSKNDGIEEIGCNNAEKLHEKNEKKVEEESLKAINQFKESQKKSIVSETICGTTMCA